MDFEKILLNSLKHEGGKGREVTGDKVNYGVRQSIYNAYAKQNNIKTKDVYDLTYGEVRDFYKKEFWERNKLDNLPDERLAALTFDYAINAGANKAIKDLQSIVGAKPDGKIGKDTIKAIEGYEYDSNMLAHQLLNSRSAYYTELYQKDPKKYGGSIDGWYERIGKLKDQYGLNVSQSLSGALSTEE